MNKNREISLEKKISKYIFSKELKFFKAKSKSPSPATATDSPNSNNNRKLKKSRKYSDFGNTSKILFPLIDDKINLISLKAKSNLIHTPFLSDLNQNHFFSMKFQKDDSKIGTSLFDSDLNSNSFVKVRGKITVNNKISSLTQTDINTNFFDLKSEFIENKNANNNNFFSNSFINNEIYDTFLNSISGSSSNSGSPSDIKNEKKNIKIKDIKQNNEKNENEETNNLNSSNSINYLSVNEKIVIKSLIELNKYNLNKEEEEIDVFEFDLEEYYFNKKYKNIISSYSSEEDLEFEKNVYEFIDSRIKLYIKSFKNKKPHRLEEKKADIKKFNNEIKKILINEKKFQNFSCLGFKSIIMSLFSLIIDFLSNNKTIFNLKKHDNLLFDSDDNLMIFINLITKFNKIKEIIPYLEKDFKEIIDNFKNEKKTEISLSDLFSDLYWDHVFKNCNINYKFANGYISNNIKRNLVYEKSRIAMDSIIDILLKCEMPYKKYIGELLSLPYMNKESVFLMDYILKYKKEYGNVITNKDIIEKKEENEDNSKNINIDIDLNKDEDKVKDKEIFNKNYKNNNKIKENKDKNTENFSLEDFYNYIQNDNNVAKGKKKNKKHKKKKKNKLEEKKNKENDIGTIIENNGKVSDNQVDPVVEEFIQYFNDYNRKNEKCIKIKPIISKEWIESIS